MEGVSYEAASLAGTNGLGKLVYFYDDNHITIDGTTSISFTEDRAARFEALGWHVQHVEDVNDLDSLRDAIANAQAETAQPSIIVCRTHIAYGAPQGGRHGEGARRRRSAPKRSRRRRRRSAGTRTSTSSSRTRSPRT